MACGCGKQNCGCYNYPSIASAIRISNSWNVPACGESALLNVPGLKTLLVGSYIWNASWGFFKVTAFNSVTQQITIKNECLTGTKPGGTVVPAGQIFDISVPPVTAPGTGAVSAIFPYVAIDFITPAVSSTVGITVTNTNGLYVNAVVSINGFKYSITAITDSTHITISNDGDGQTPGETISARDSSGFYQYPISQVAVDNSAFVTWTPTLTGSGSMTVTAQTIYDSFLFEFNGVVYFRLFAGFTIGGTPDIYVQVPFPFAVVPFGGSPGYICTAEENFGDPFSAKYSLVTSPNLVVYHESLAAWAPGGGNIGIMGFVKKA